MPNKQIDTLLLLVNIGSPDVPTPRGVRRYLSRFLHDRRVIEYTRFLWCPLLHGVILPLRGHVVAQKYKSIWRAEGAPLTVISTQLAVRLQAAIDDDSVAVVAAMRYGHPDIATVVAAYASVRTVLVLPLYPQYAASTTASAYDGVFTAYKKRRFVPAIHLLGSYATHPAYIEALTIQVVDFYRTRTPSDCLLLSFHGLPERMCTLGDPYAQECAATTTLLQAALLKTLGEKFSRTRICMSYQSRFGKGAWLSPATTDVLDTLCAEGVRSVDVLFPGFAVDCLETLEEIADCAKKQFLRAGGRSFRTIPALNDSAAHVTLLHTLIRPYLTACRTHR